MAITMMAQLPDKPKQPAIMPVLNQMQPSFWTKEIMEKFLLTSLQDSCNLSDSQKQDMLRFDGLYKKILDIQIRLKQAHKNGRPYEIDDLMKQLNSTRIQHDQKHSEIQGNKLRVRGGSFALDDCFIDLHNLSLVGAKKLLKSRISAIRHKLQSGSIVPNIGDGRNHVIKVVTGKGEHSPTEPVLRKNVPFFIYKDLGFEICDMTSKGVILVRIKTGIS